MPPLFHRTRRHSSMSCFSMVSASPEPSQVASEIVVPRKHLRRFSSVGNVMRSKKSGPASEANDDSDLAISYPWNFQHKIHVDEHLNGLPETWSTLLEKPKGLETVDERQSSESPMCAPTSEISPPSAIQHNIHVDENLNGLPPAWAALLAKSGQEKPPKSARRRSVAIESPVFQAGGDPYISLPWNFKHDIHASAGADGLPRNLPPMFIERLSEVGYTEVEVAAIRGGV
ncbi:hypothetical protein POSPLADRAFT_1067695 [Postia placenta MAD-698-R-SB12]|uniref:CRIB domain-containing protein n=1 Tax=Postia placenta MAD-698-R-SB12 TaxID=670580 RepID=A0A1X6MPB0_9APHY|nr:hypothetical protein POSPLADRAFT_1067695 [Postia placenta MAD-698-R-SB12]OSX58032.1 hypothetical protein POSPLADRAFT_1067695 [Postia placenta MAD-698-R-SB12]